MIKVLGEIGLSITFLLEELSDIKEVIMISKESVKRVISRCSPLQKKLIKIFDLHKMANELGIQPPYP